VLAVLAVSVTGSVPLTGASRQAGEVYVALGDSYTAGPVVPTQLPDPPGCFRSDQNYPHVLAPALPAAGFADVSCSGATTAAMTAPQAVPGGANPPQFDRLDATTTLVTIGIGGNDIGFTDIAISCISIDPNATPCLDRYVVGGVDEVSGRIAAAAPNVLAAFQGITARAPNARVFVVAYIAIVPADGVACRPQLLYSQPDIEYLRDKQQELNAMIAGQATTAGATYVDAYAASVGHDACQAPGVRWVEPIVAASPAAPLHPNALGMQCVASVVQAAVQPGAPTTITCPQGATPVAASPRFTG